MTSRDCAFRGVTVLLALFGLDAKAGAGVKTATMCPRWVSGETVYVEWRWQNVLNFSGDGVPQGGQRQRQDTTVGYLLHVDDVPGAGMASITLTIDRVAVAAEGSAGEGMSFDTDCHV